MRFQDSIFSKQLQKSLHELLTSGISCDVTIQVDNREFKAHKCVLSAASLYFRTMFYSIGKFKESEEDKIILNEIDSEAVEAIINFIYTSNVEITESNVYPLMEACNFFQIYAMRAWISRFLESTISAKNCLSMYVTASAYSYNDVARSTLSYIFKNFSEVADGDEFLHIHLDLLLKILSSKFLNVLSENELLMYVLKWVKTDVQNRKEHILKLVNKLELGNIHVDSILQFINNPLFNKLLNNKLEDFKKGLQPLMEETKSEYYENKKDYWETIRHEAECEVILAIGGESSGVASRNVECFTIGYDSWKCVIPQYVESSRIPKNMTVIPAMRYARYNAAVAHDSYNVYVLGGRNSSNFLDECETYNVKSNTWKNLSNIPCKLEGSGAALLEGQLVITGGRNELGPVNNAWSWDDKRKCWKDLPPLSCARSFHGIVAAAGYIFVLGGYDKNEDPLRTAERFDPNLNKWVDIGCMQEARAKFGCGVVDNHIYVIGGKNKFCGMKSIERYDFETNQWSFMRPMAVPRHSFSVAVDGKRMYCIGGCDDVHLLCATDKFNPLSNRWHVIVSMQVSRLGLSAAILKIPSFECKLRSQLKFKN